MPSTRKADLKRVVFLRDKHAEGVQEAFASKPSMSRFGRLERLGSPAVFDFLLAFDPTPKGIYLQTILRWFTKGTIHLEDGRRTRDVLARFEASKHSLEIDARDINRHASPGDIEEIFDQASRGGVPVSLSVPDYILAMSPVMASGDDWIIVRLDTYAASKWWADSTSWCTRHEPMYRSYTEASPLYVLQQGSRKLQVSHRYRQLMDSYDRPVTEQTIADFTEPAILALRDVILQEHCVSRQPIDDETGDTAPSLFSMDYYPALFQNLDSDRLLMLDGDRPVALVSTDKRVGDRVVGFRILPTGPMPLELPDTRMDFELERLADFSKMSSRFKKVLLDFYTGLADPLPATKTRDMPAPFEVSGVVFQDIWSFFPGPAPDCGPTRGHMVFKDGLPVAMVCETTGKIDLDRRDDTSNMQGQIHVRSLSDLHDTPFPPCPDHLKGPSDVESLDDFWKSVLVSVFEQRRPENETTLAFGKSILGLESRKKWFGFGDNAIVDKLEPARNSYGVISDFHNSYHAYSDAQVDDLIDLICPYPDDPVKCICGYQGLNIDRSGRFFSRLSMKVPPAITRLAGSMEIRNGMVYRLDGKEANVRDILLASRIPGSGYLLAALPPEKRSARLVDLLVARGRGGALSAIPPALATERRIRALMQTNEWDNPVLCMDSVSVQLYSRVWEILHPGNTVFDRNWSEMKDRAGGHFETHLAQATMTLHGGYMSLCKKAWEYRRLRPYLGHEALADLDTSSEISKLLAKYPILAKRLFEDLSGYELHSVPLTFVIAWAGFDNDIGMGAVDYVDRGMWPEYEDRSRLLERLALSNPSLVDTMGNTVREFSLKAKLELLDRKPSFLEFIDEHELTPQMVSVVSRAMSTARRTEDTDSLRTIPDMVGDLFGMQAWRRKVFSMLDKVEAPEALLDAVPWPSNRNEEKLVKMVSSRVGRKIVPFGEKPVPGLFDRLLSRFA